MFEVIIQKLSQLIIRYFPGLHKGFFVLLNNWLQFLLFIFFLWWFLYFLGGLRLFYSFLWLFSMFFWACAFIVTFVCHKMLFIELIHSTVCSHYLNIIFSSLLIFLAFSEWFLLWRLILCHFLCLWLTPCPWKFNHIIFWWKCFILTKFFSRLLFMFAGYWHFLEFFDFLWDLFFFLFNSLFVVLFLKVPLGRNRILFLDIDFILLLSHT